MKKNSKFLACASGAAIAINGILISKGIETIPNLWLSEVLTHSNFGLSLGSTNGISLGGLSNATIATKDEVTHKISLFKEKFSKINKNNSLII